MSGKNFTVIEGGQSTQWQGRDKQLAPELGALFARMRKYRAHIVKAYQPILESVYDLAQDWATRDEAFWQIILEELPRLREAVHGCYIWSNALSFNDIPTSFQSSVTFWLCSVESSIDPVGIEITAYLPVCVSLQIKHLQQRQRILQMLQSIMRNTKSVLDLLGTEGQQQCSQEYQRSQEVAARKANQSAQPEQDQPNDQDGEKPQLQVGDAVSFPLAKHGEYTGSTGIIAGPVYPDPFDRRPICLVHVRGHGPSVVFAVSDLVREEGQI